MCTSPLYIATMLGVCTSPLYIATMLGVCTSPLYIATMLGVYPPSPQRVHLDISIGEHAVDYAQIASKEKLSELQLRVRQLLDQVEQITKEQEYQRVSLLWLL